MGHWRGLYLLLALYIFALVLFFTELCFDPLQLALEIINLEIEFPDHAFGKVRPFGQFILNLFVNFQLLLEWSYLLL